MASSYLQSKITEALSKADGSASTARKLLMNWAMEDDELLRLLTKNHLNGIVAYHVERALPGLKSKTSSARLKGSDIPSKPRPASRHAVPASEAIRNTIKPSSRTDQMDRKAFGAEMLKAMTRHDAAIFGLESYTPRPSRKGASAEHIDAILKMARKSS